MNNLLNFKEFLNESSLARIQKHVRERNIGIITAHRGENSADENVSKNKELEHDIRKAGHGFIHVKGRYIENRGTPHQREVNSEHSYIVVGKKGHDEGHLKGFMMKHGAKYHQDSVLYKPHNTTRASFLYTRHVGDKKKGHQEDVGDFHPKKMGDYHSRLMHSHHAFSFSEGTDVEYTFLVLQTPVSYNKGREVEFIEEDE